MTKKSFDEAAHLLLMEIFHPSRVERALCWCKIKAWEISDERGPVNWVGDRLDDLEMFYRRRRFQVRRALGRKP